METKSNTDEVRKDAQIVARVPQDLKERAVKMAGKNRWSLAVYLEVALEEKLARDEAAEKAREGEVN